MLNVKRNVIGTAWREFEIRRLNEATNKFTNVELQSGKNGVWTLVRKKVMTKDAVECRERWQQGRGRRNKFEDGEIAMLIELHARHGNKWALIESKLPTMTRQQAANYYTKHSELFDKPPQSIKPVPWSARVKTPRVGQFVHR